MSAKLEGVVRPFQTRNISPPQRVLTAYEQDPDKVVLEFGRGGSGKTMSGSYSVTQSFYMDTKLKEQSVQLRIP